MVAFNYDISTLLSRIAELEETLAALRADIEPTAIALVKSEVGVFDCNLDKKTVYVSPLLQEMLRHKGESMPLDPLTWIQYVAPDDRYRVQAELREALMYGPEEFQGIFRMNRKDGNQRLFLFRGVIMRLSRVDGGDAFRVVGTAIDVTTIL